MTDYKRHIISLKADGIPYRTFINDGGNMVIRYSEHNDDYTELMFDPAAKLIQVISVDDGYTHIQGGIF